MASSKPDFLPPLTEEDRTVFINRKLLDILPVILSTVISWGCKKADHESFEFYLKKYKGLTDADIKTKFKKDLTKLMKISVVGLDVTFLCQLLPAVCDGITEMGSPEWKNKDDTKLECQLSKLAQLRNDVMHAPEGMAMDQNLSTEVETITLKLLDNAGLKYLKGADVIKKAKDKVKDLIEDVRVTVLTDREKESFQYQKLIIKEGIPELRERVKASRASCSSYLQYITNFYCLQLTCEEQVKGKMSEITIPCTDIFKFSAEKNVRILLIEGPSGSGKSFLMREIQADLLQKGNKRRFTGSDSFQTPFLFACKTLTSKTLLDLVSQTFPISALKLKKTHLVGSALFWMKCIFLIDGLDELNYNSRDLVEQIIVYLQNNKEAMCVFTSRSHSIRIWQEKLQFEGLSFETLKINQLTSKEEQKSFFNEACEKGFEISAAYEKTKLKLHSPLQLGLFSYFFSVDPNSVMSWTSPCQIMQKTVEYSFNVAKQRLLAKKVENCEDICRDVLERICYISFCCLFKNKLILETPEVEYLKEKTRKRCANVQPSSILSCFLPSISSSSIQDDIEFFHKSHQEFLAGSYVGLQMKETHQGIENIISTSLEMYEGAFEYEEKKEVKEKVDAEHRKIILFLMK